jgi:hypothetical protein
VEGHTASIFRDDFDPGWFIASLITLLTFKEIFFYGKKFVVASAIYLVLSVLHATSTVDMSAIFATGEWITFLDDTKKSLSLRRNG